MKSIKIIDGWGLGDTLILYCNLSPIFSSFFIKWLVKYNVNKDLLKHLSRSNKNFKIYLLSNFLNNLFSHITIIPHGYPLYKRIIFRLFSISWKLYEIEIKNEIYYLRKRKFILFSQEIGRQNTVTGINNILMLSILETNISEYPMVNKNNLKYFVESLPNKNLLKYKSLIKKNFTFNKKKLVVFPGCNEINKIKSLKLDDIKDFNFINQKLLIIGPGDTFIDQDEYINAGFVICRINNFSSIKKFCNDSLILSADNFYSHYCSLICDQNVFVKDKVGNAYKYMNHRIVYI